MNSFSLFPNLPEDIGRSIFEISVEDGNGLPCALVSKQVQSWVDPILYKRVSLLKYRQAHQFYRTILTSTKPPEFFAQHVKVIVFDTGDSSIVFRFLNTLKNVKVMAYWRQSSGDFLSNNDRAWGLLKTIQVKLTRFSLSCRGRFEQDFSFPIFRNLTHLEIRLRNEGPRLGADHGWKWDTLKPLTHLTHLSFGNFFEFDDDLVQFTEKVLQSSPQSLLVLVVSLVLKVADLQNLEATRFDRRVVLAASEGSDDAFVHERVVLRSVDELARDWAGASDDADFWTQAEAMVANPSQSK